MIQVNPIILPSWIGNKAVFQQNVPFVIEGKAAPSATITLEISKDAIAAVENGEISKDTK